MLFLQFLDPPLSNAFKYFHIIGDLNGMTAIGTCITPLNDTATGIGDALPPQIAINQRAVAAGQK